MENRLAWSTNPVRYTIIHRRKGNRRAYRYGCYSYSLDEMLEIGQLEAESGNYAMVKVINADTDEIIRILRGGMR